MNYAILDINEFASDERINSEWKLFPLVAEACRYSAMRLIEYTSRFYEGSTMWPDIDDSTMANIVNYSRTKPSYIKNDGAVRLYHYTKSCCREVAYILAAYIHDYLEVSTSEGGVKEDLGVEVSVLSLEGQGLKYFLSAHHPVMIEDKHSSECYIASPACAFNGDGTLPEIEGVNFDRINNVIAARSPELALRALCSLECESHIAIDQWKKYSFVYELFDNTFNGKPPIDILTDNTDTI